MKCRICEKFYIPKTSFKNLFDFDDICDACREEYKPNPKTEIIPYTNGVVEYHYLYDQVSLNVKQISQLETNLTLIYDYIFHHASEKIPVLFLSERDMSDFSEDIKYLSPYPKLLIVSLVRCNLEQLMKIF